MNTMNLVTGLLAGCLAASTTMAGVTIEQIAPRNTILVASIDDVADSRSRWASTGLDAACEAEAIQAICADFLAHDDLRATLGLESLVDLVPVGAAGFAVYPATDHELHSTEVGVLAMADFGEQGVSRGVTIGTIVEKMLGEMQDGGYVRVERITVGEHDVWSIEEGGRDEWKSGDSIDDLDGFNPGAMMMTPPGLDRLYLVVADGVLLVGTDLEGFGRALEIIDGDEPEDMLDSHEPFTTMVEGMGPTEARAVLLTADLGELIDMMDPTGMTMMMGKPILKTAMGTVGGIAYGVRLESDEGLLEATSMISLPEGKGGLMALFDTAAPAGEVPGFVGTDTVAYARINVRFEEVLPWLKSLVLATPFAFQAAPVFEEFEPIVKQALVTLDTEVHSITSSAQHGGGLRTLLAAKCTNTQQFGDVLAALAPQAGMEPRDFLGHQVWTMDLPMGGMGMDSMGGTVGFQPPFESFSVAPAAGWVLSGQTVAVEEALRSLDRRGVAADQGGEAYERISRLVAGRDLAGWGWLDIVAQMKAQFAQVRAQVDTMSIEIEEFDPEMAEEMREEMIGSLAIPEAILEAVEPMVGPLVWKLESIEEGYRSTAIVLPVGSE